MAPVTIYIVLAVIMTALSIAVWVNRYYATRKCHLCGAQVELGRSKCHACAYRFIN